MLNSVLLILVVITCINLNVGTSSDNSSLSWICHWYVTENTKALNSYNIKFCCLHFQCRITIVYISNNALIGNVNIMCVDYNCHIYEFQSSTMATDILLFFYRAFGMMQGSSRCHVEGTVCLCALHSRHRSTLYGYTHIPSV